VGSWQPTAPGVPSQEVLVGVEGLEVADERFCYGGTTMYMDGFHWLDPTCVIYLFPQWVLTTGGSLVGACFGTIFFGMALEGVIRKRRDVVQSLPGGWKRLGASTIFYGVQLTMGYMLMLVIMTYSGPLFMCVILGLMSGHALFNANGAKSAKEIKQKATDESQGDGSDCCGTGPVDECPCKLDNHRDDSGPFVPEGSTPCCQNTM
jgi:hypothetical protein